ncbi:MAG TPA: DUF362 domain-containing protein [Nitrospirota bacterium]|nr:DUF362 domain-containing protein [Nitrospirota bacterium]
MPGKAGVGSHFRTVAGWKIFKGMECRFVFKRNVFLLFAIRFVHPDQETCFAQIKRKPRFVRGQLDASHVFYFDKLKTRHYMQDRRHFLKALTLTGSALFLNYRDLLSESMYNVHFGLNQFIETHPDAVFILRTNVDSKTDASAILDAGHKLGTSLFQVESDPSSGYPISTNVVIKPNITWWDWDIAPIEDVMGIQTDPHFVEGVIGALTDLSMQPSNIFIRDGNYFGPDSTSGKNYAAMAKRANVDLKDVSAGVGILDEKDIQWRDIQSGIWFKKIPYIWPINATNSCTINISKFKSHSMGMTLCSKNLQGTIARPYIAHCTAWNTDMSGVDSQNVVPDAFSTIKDNYERHKNAGIPRWDIPGDSSGGIWMETWASRCLDNNASLKPLLNIIEGVYGREGPFVSGPDDGYGKDFLTNIVIFGKNSFHVDIIGTYLAGHEPGNFGLFHMAMEHKLSNYLNPFDIPVYEWNLDGSVVRSDLSGFSRTPIRTPYLQKTGEEEYHMVDEPYDYSMSVSAPKPRLTAPGLFAIQQNFPNPFNPTTSIRFHIPSPGFVRIEIFDIKGSRVTVLVDNYLHAGDHVSVWNSNNAPSGTYFYRMSFQGSAITKSMVLIR